MTVYHAPLPLTHWGRVTHVCASNLTIIGLSPGRGKALSKPMLNIVDWTLKNKLKRNFHLNSKFFIQEKHLNVSSGKWRPFCLGLNVLKNYIMINPSSDSHWSWGSKTYAGTMMTAILDTFPQIFFVFFRMCRYFRRSKWFCKGAFKFSGNIAIFQW